MDHNYKDPNAQFFDGNGTYSSGSYTENADNIYMEASHPGKSAYGMTEVSMTSKELIDLAKYKKMKIDAEFATNYNAFWHANAINEQGEYIELGSWDVGGVIPVELEDIQKQIVNITLSSSATRGTVGELVIKAVWLEK